ncbi:MAG TPA: pre-peptidase C-terminal domain-containing protein, partial [Pirellulaceae bacterium]|nr:pre-peptidase C-terminal domain-containing protein [Pirellulaceae bacterium]
DDLYRIEVYSQDNATAGQTALRNNLNQAFTPTLPGLDRDIVEFDLKLGPQVVAVVPQPVSRNSTAGGGFAGIDTSRRNQIDVYFNEDDLLDDNTSAEKPQFYKLIYTADTVRNTDDTTYTPTSVSYDPVANRATLTFAQPIDQLGSGAGTFRLRIGTDEPTPSAPNTVTPAGDAGSSFTTADATSLGVAGVLSGTNITSTIITSTISSSAPAYTLDYPGAEDEPGHREIQPESHYINGPDTAGIPTQAYNFQSAYGTDPFGNTLNNQITDEQKQRAREIFELYSRISGIRFYETASSGFTIATGDLRAIDPTIPTGVGGILGLADNKTNRAIMDALEPWSDAFGGDWMETAMHEIGHLLGMKHTYDLPNAIMGDINGTSNGSTTYAATAQESIWPLDGDVVHMQHLYRPEVRDVDMYRFTVPVGTTGSLAIETFADRLQIKTTANGILDTQLRLYRELPDGTRELIAQNDDYFGDDSFIGIDSIDAGNYFIGVTAKGTEFDPKVADSGLGGQSEGKYELRVNFRPAATT